MNGRTLLFHGPFGRHSDTAEINTRLVDGLRAAGWQVWPVAQDAVASRPPDLPVPDVYLFHGHPYDLINAPGRLNAFLLDYDYARFTTDDPHLAMRLNGCFDLLLVPSRFVRAACRRSGVRIPIVLCPYGVDRDEFHPGATPVEIPNRRRFCFLTIGPCSERAGTDLLVDAYTREFDADDDVTLVIAAGAEDLRDGWLDREVERALARHRNPPHLVCERPDRGATAGYYAASDAGVFPFRAEGFGLRALRCLAAGRPAIVTRAGGAPDFGRAGVTWLRARPSRARGRAQFEPDRRELQRLMRAAVERGPASGRAQDSIAASTRRFTWMRAVEIVDTVLERMWTRGSRVRRVPHSPSDRIRTGPSVFFFDGRPGSDRSRTSARIDALLARRHPHHRSIPFDAPRSPGRVPLVVGQAGSCLEGFLTAASGARRLLHCNRAPFEAQLAATNRERHAVGLAAAPVSPLDLWRHQEEARLADRIVVSSRRSRAQFRQAGHAAAQLRVVPPGVDRAAVHRRPSNAAVRFMFVSTDPFRSGIRVLLEAFGRVEGPRLELWCITTREILEAPVVLRHLRADSRVSVRRLLGHRGFLRLYEQVDVVVLPSFAEGFGRVVADGMMRGKPGIVSDRTGVSEVISDGASGVIVPAGDVGRLTAALDGLARDRRRIRTLGDAAHEAVRALTWSLFSARFNTVLDEWEQP